MSKSGTPPAAPEAQGEATHSASSPTPPLGPSPPSPELTTHRSPSASIKSQIQLRPTSFADDAEGEDDEPLPSRIVARQLFPTRNGAEAGDNDQDDDDDDDDDEDEDDQESPFVRGRIDVGRTAWDDSEEEDNPIDNFDDDASEDEDAAPLALSSAPRSGSLRWRETPARRTPITPTGWLADLRPTPTKLKQWWSALTKADPAQASVSAPNVALNLFSASLHPAVLLSMPAYFERIGYPAGIVGLVIVAILGGAGGGLWVVLSRYVGGNSVEAIVGSSFGRNTRWRSNVGRAISGVLLAIYATGAAAIAYFALADLLLQLSFHYSPRGIPLHDRGFVTLVLGGLLTAPLVIFPLAKRTLIKLSTNLAVLVYPILLWILFSKIYQSPEKGLVAATFDKHQRLPSFNPMDNPSVWSSYSLLPLLTLSSSPLQILAHNRSLRRTGLSGSNVKAFMGAQAAQVLLVIGLSVAFGIGIGTEGIKDRLKEEIHPNLFASLSVDDDLINFARGLFVILLSSHFALCLVTARSSWGRLLRLFHLNPLRRRRAQPIALPTTTRGPGSAHAKPPRQWGKLARNSLAGAILWGISASIAFFSGVGGLRRSEKEGEEARFVRAEEVLGLVGAAVGFVIPALVWIILFHIRRPRAILPPFASEVGRQASAWFLGPLSALARQRLRSGASASSAPETEPLLGGSGGGGQENVDESTRAFRAALHTQAGPGPVGEAPSGGSAAATWANESAADTQDAATRILLARKERQLQKRTRGRRVYQDLLVIAGILPLGVALIVLGALDLSHGSW